MEAFGICIENQNEKYPIARRRFKIVGIKNHPDEIPQAKRFEFSF